MTRCLMASELRAVRASSILSLLLLIVHGGVTQDSCGDGPWDNRLLIIKEGSITRANLDGGDQELAFEAPSISGIIGGFDYSHAHKSLFWGDFNSGQIWKLRNGESKPEPALPSQGRWWPCHLKVDDFGEKMYVVDCWSNSVNIFDMKTGDRAVVLAKNFTEIRAFEMDTRAGYLFIVGKYRVLRTDLDGKNPVVLHEEFTNLEQIYAGVWESLPNEVKEYLKNPDQTRDNKESKDEIKKLLTISDITLDLESKRIYFVDTAKRSVESFDYNGQDPRVHYLEETRDDSLTKPESVLRFLDGWLYWLNRINQKLYKINVKSKDQPQVVVSKDDDLQTIIPVGCPGDYETNSSPCAKNKGQCQQLCVFSKSNEKNFSCACKIGYELNADGKSCSPVEEFILYTQSGSLRGHSMNVTLQTFTDVINPSAFSVGKSTGIQFNAADELVYYSSLYPDNQIHQVSLKTGEVKVLQPDLLSSKVGINMAFDWESRNLYYFTYYYNDVTTLSVINVDDPTYSKILVQNVQRLVRAIAVHPHLGYVYLAQESDDDWTTISRMATDGSGLTVLIHQKGSINDLAIDYQENRLYWSEPQKIWCSNLDGKDMREFNFTNPTLDSVTSMTIYKNHIYMISKYDQVLSRSDKNELTSAEIVSNSEELNSFSGIEIFSRWSQKKRPGHPCSRHKCQKFCFPVPNSQGNLRATCGCPYGEKLAQDGQTCEDNRDREPSFVPCQSSSFLCSMKTES